MGVRCPDLAAIAAKRRNLRCTRRLVGKCYSLGKDRPCPRETNRSIRTSKTARPSILNKSYESRGVPEKEAERRAWATVNKDDGGGKKAGGSGRGKSTGHPAAHKGGRIGGSASAARPAASRSAAAKKAAATRKRNAAHAAN